MKLTTTSPTILNTNLSYDLFKMKTDCPSFEEFEKLFEDEKESVPEVPANNYEWNRCKVR